MLFPLVYLAVTLVSLVAVFLAFDDDLYESKLGLDRTEWIIAVFGWPVFLPIALLVGWAYGVARLAGWVWHIGR